MTVRGAISIEVIPDTSKFAGLVQRELKTALRGMQLRPVPVQGDTTPFLRQVRTATGEADKSFRDMFDHLQTRAARAGSGIGSALGKGLAASLTTAIGPAIQGAVALLTSIGPAALTAVPAAVGVLGTLQVALFGVGDALKEVGADQEKFDQAIEGLSPNAKRFAQALRSILPDLTQLKNAVQDRFFADFDTDIKAVAKNLLGPLRAGMTGVAGDLNGVVRQLGAFGASAKGAQVVNTIFSVTRSVLAQVSAAFGPLLDRVGDWIIKAGNSGVNSALLKAREILTSLAKAADNVGGALGAIFGGLSKDGAAVAASLVQATAAVRTFLESAQAQELLRTLGSAMDRVREIALQILAVLPALIPAITGLASGGFGVLLDVVQKIVDLLSPLAEGLGGQQELFANIGAAIAITVVAVKAYQAALAVLTAAQIAWNVATTVGSAVALVATAAYNTARVAALLLSTAFLQASLAIYGTISSLYAQVAALAVAVAGWVRLAVSTAAASLQLTLYATALRVGRAAVIAWTAAQWLLNVALTANPIGIVIAVIAALVTAIVVAYQKSDTFRAIVQGAFQAIGTAAMWLWNNALKPLWDGLVAAFNFVAQAASNWWSRMQEAFQFVIQGALRLHQAISNFFISMVAGIVGTISNLIAFVSSIPGRILGALGNLGSLLYNAGVNLIQGLINGVSSMISSLASKLSFITKLIPDWKGPEDKDRRLLVPAGRAIMQGLQVGIGDEQINLQRQLAAITNQIALAPMPSGSSPSARGGDGAELTSGNGVRVWPSQPAKADNTIVIQSDGTKYSELLVQELSKAIRVRGGVVQKVLGKTQGGVQ